MRRSRVGRRAVLGLIAIIGLGLTVSCTVGPSGRPSLVVAGQRPPATSTGANPVGPRALPPLEKPTGQVEWSDCTSQTVQRLGDPPPPASLGFQCARVIGALNPSDQQDASEVRLALLKVGDGPTPLLVLNDIDGLPGSLYAARLAAELPASFLHTYSLIGVDRRGTGDSDGVHCIPQADRDEIVGYDPADTDVSRLLDASVDASQQCVLELDARASALNTTNTADDLELLREQFGLTYLSAIGHGEGSRVLTVYANRYPGRVGRMVLDGSPDPSASGTDTAQAQAAAAEALFSVFAADCVHRGGCPLGNDPTGALTALLGQLRDQPLTAPDGTEIGAGDALQGVLAGLLDRTEWPTLASALGQARTGNGSVLAGLVEPLLTGTQYDPARLDADLVSGCNDQPDRLSPAQVSAAITAWGRKAPLFGALYAQRMLWCAPWPVPVQQLPKPNAPGTPPILVLSTANDPVTPGGGSQRTAADLANGVLVGWQGSGHGALGASSCATKAATAFLINGTVPQNFTSCPP